MHLEEFAEGDSLLHRLDPRVKFVSLIPYALVVATMDGLSGLCLALATSVVLLILARLDLKKVIKRLAVVNLFVLMLWFFVPLSYPGERLFSIGPLQATKEGVVYMFSISLKTNSIVLATIAILGTSGVFSLAHALVHLRMPAKLVNLFFFFYRYISVLHEEYTRLRNAMTIRCFKPGTNRHTYRTYAYLIGMLLVRSYERSQMVYKAMLCRGFRGNFPVMNHFRLKSVDVVFGTVMFLLTIAILLV